MDGWIKEKTDRQTKGRREVFLGERNKRRKEIPLSANKRSEREQEERQRKKREAETHRGRGE